MSDPSSPADTEQRLFARALELRGEAERAAYLHEACGHNARLRQRVEELLRAYFAADNFIASQRDDDFDSDDSSLPEGPGTVIGRYKLLEPIGEGGFGVVYLAEQQEPVRRQVALKIIKPGMDTRQVIARFEAERQALALMDHPNIAKVLDGGVVGRKAESGKQKAEIETGRPYFVMELVRGIPITRFCEENRLSIKDRLELFIPVCHAIQHAHQKGVIHRDIKPSNVLVTLDNGVPHPMVIDFGVAKAIHQPLTEKTLHTRFAQMIGTPAYMSPEQAEMSKQDVDTRTDVYSLGILLYELLTGTTPFPEERLRTASCAEIQRIISEEEPVRPSTVVTRLNGRLRTIALNRRCEPAAFIKLIRGDLDWIVLKAIDKDRNRRYATPNGLAADVRRHLANEPVTASPPSTTYRLSRFVRRNQRLAVAGTAVFVALLVGLGAAMWQAMRAQQQARWARLNEYGAEVSLAQRIMREGNLGRARELLSDDIPAPGEEDLRGWEWYYLWNQFISDAAFQLGEHPDAVLTVAYSPNGRLVASADRAGGIRLWDLAARRLLETWAEDQGVHRALFYSDEVVVTGSDNGKIRFYALGQATAGNIGRGALGPGRCSFSKSRPACWADGRLRQRESHGLGALAPTRGTGKPIPVHLRFTRYGVHRQASRFMTKEHLYSRLMGRNWPRATAMERYAFTAR
jgi:eukaryotic-like serine/threonine-protein kinase